MSGNLDIEKGNVSKQKKYDVHYVNTMKPVDKIQVGKSLTGKRGILYPLSEGNGQEHWDG